MKEEEVGAVYVEERRRSQTVDEAVDRVTERTKMRRRTVRKIIVKWAKGEERREVMNARGEGG